MDNVKFLSDNWQIIISAPFVFISFAIIMFSLACFIMHFIYKERIETLKEKAAIKEDFLNEYRQRLHIVDTNNTYYSNLTNKELKSKVSKLISHMREFLSIKVSEDNQYHAAISQPFWQAKSNEEREKILIAAIPPFLTTKSAIQIEYGEKYQSDAILLRDELLSRLPEDQKNNDAHIFYLYLSNTFGLKMVIADLERLLKSLPD